MTFSEKLKLLRKEKNLNQEEASKKIGIALSSLRKYEQVGNPDVVQLKKIAEFYGVSYDYLLNDNCNTRSVSNLEIVNTLGITENTINAIKRIEDKAFLEDIFESKYCEKITKCLKEKAETSFVCNYGINRFCNRLFKEATFENLTTVSINTIKIILDYMKSPKLEQSYWDFIMSGYECNAFVDSLNYLLETFKKNKKVNDMELQGLSPEILKAIVNNLLEYDKHCNITCLNVIDDFSKEYLENKVFEIK